MGPVQAAGALDSRESFTIRKGVEGYILGHGWQVPKELTERQKEQQQWPWEQKFEEFAYTTKNEAMQKLNELLQ